MAYENVKCLNLSLSVFLPVHCAYFSCILKKKIVIGLLQQLLVLRYCHEKNKN